MKKENKIKEKTKNDSTPKKVIKVFVRILLGSLFMLSVIALIAGLAFAIYVDRKVEKHIDEIIEEVKIGQREINYSYYEGINLEEKVNAMIEARLGINSEEL